MPNMEIINISKEQLDNMKVRKYDDNDKPKIWVSDGILYKKDLHCLIKKYKEDFEILREYDDLKNCVFPENMFFVDGKYMGYTTTYFEDYKSINFRMYKNKYTINQKKKIMKKIVKLLTKLNDNDILHADLNTSNIICDKKNVKLIDFDRIRLREYEDETIYDWRLKEQINYLNIALLTVLFDVDLINISNDEYKELIDQITFSNEYKQYLLNCLLSKEKEIPKEIFDYIDSIKRRDIVKGKELIKTLHI